jgi:hypothetical protein
MMMDGAVTFVAEVVVTTAAVEMKDVVEITASRDAAAMTRMGTAVGAVFRVLTQVPLVLLYV